MVNSARPCIDLTVGSLLCRLDLLRPKAQAPMNLEVPGDTLEKDPKHQALEHQHHTNAQAQVSEDPVVLLRIGLNLKD